VSDWQTGEPTGLTPREARRKARAEQGEAIAEAARKINLLSADERVEMACRSDLSEADQWAIASFGNDPEVAEAVLSNPSIPSEVQYLARNIARENRPWWRKLLWPY
jgi:hypothetical protein